MSLNLELHSQNLLLYPILQNLDEGILITDSTLNVVFCNENAGEILGLNPKQVLGQNAESLKPHLNFDNISKEHFKPIDDIRVINEYEVNITRGFLEIRPDCFVAYAILRTIDSFKDYQLNTFLQSPYEGIAIFDNNAHLLYSNDLCREFFSSASNSELSQTMAALIPWTNLQQAIERGKTFSSEVLSPGGQALRLLFLPIMQQSRNLGVIVKSSQIDLCRVNEWEQLLEQHQQGTARYSINNIVGNNQLICKQKALATRAARSISTVLITGESGTGKEIFAHAIHNMSPRRKGPFIKVNCAAVPETLLESELFGYNEGAFTGALKEGKPGKFELANHGTIFLDEIADMSLSMQAKLLRVLQEKEVERIGSLNSTKINIRVIAATNKNLAKLVSEKEFREDLFYRLNVIVLNLIPLRKRIDDIPLLSHHLLHRLNRELGTRVENISSEAIEQFCSYDWPGNIRELENTIERAVNFCEGHTITTNDIPNNIIQKKSSYLSTSDYHSSLDNILNKHEKAIIEEVLKNCGGNKSKAAKTLNIHRSVLYRKLYKYNIEL